ncbi:DoxX family protein [Mucilaginibacter sp. RS28]|uniref:DoxX family protein n=1 Tax=Mucilaginibacter straminoryzae TaxID=2932774 RepID=A0A9X1X1Q6_9SPHI|nr:DoxX family protein [Mucilaginibacter straminoryzae]MCJ8209562.1 DoxX family protein [Mucilaginibacter straminoryzae]
MILKIKIDQLHARAKNNKWMYYFSVFCRVALAAGFLPSGFVKIMGERFTSLSNNHPMGHYLEALYHTGYYYTFIGVAQVTAAVLLLIPQTVVLGALLYFPIILNICILSLSVRFDGSLLSSPLMVLANLYVLLWNYDKIRFILPFNATAKTHALIKRDNSFPIKFFSAVAAVIVILILTLPKAFDIMPRNTLNDCKRQCKDPKGSNACEVFCDCIHNNGLPLDKSLAMYHQLLNKNSDIKK